MPYAGAEGGGKNAEKGGEGKGGDGGDNGEGGNGEEETKERIFDIIRKSSFVYTYLINWAFEFNSHKNNIPQKGHNL